MEEDAVQWIQDNCEYVPGAFLPSRIIMTMRDHSHQKMQYVRRAMDKVFKGKAVYKQLGPLRGFENIKVYLYEARILD